MNEINRRLVYLISDFLEFEDEALRLHHLAHLGATTKTLQSEQVFSEKNRFYICDVPIWFTTSIPPSGFLSVKVYSPSDVVAGLGALLIKVYNGAPAKDAAAVDMSGIIVGIGLENRISSGRQMTFHAMRKAIEDAIGAHLNETLK